MFLGIHWEKSIKIEFLWFYDTFFFIEYASIIKEKNKAIEKLEGSLEKQQEGKKFV